MNKKAGPIFKDDEALYLELRECIYSQEEIGIIDIALKVQDELSSILKEVFTLNRLNKAIHDYRWAKSVYGEKVVVDTIDENALRGMKLLNGLCYYLFKTFDINYDTTRILIEFFGIEKVVGGIYIAGLGETSLRLNLLIKIRMELYNV